MAPPIYNIWDGFAFSVHVRVAFCDDFQCNVQVFVVEDPANLGNRSLWAAVLQGAYVVTPGVMLHSKGAAVKYNAALKVKRKIWISGDFEHKRPAVTKVIRDSVASYAEGGLNACWKLIASEDCASIATCTLT